MSKKYFENTELLNIVGYIVIGAEYYDMDEIDIAYIYSKEGIINLANENRLEENDALFTDFDKAITFLKESCEYKVMAVHN